MGDKILYFNEKLLKWEMLILLILCGLGLLMLIPTFLFPTMAIGWVFAIINTPILLVLPFVYLFQIVLLFLYETNTLERVLKYGLILLLYLALVAIASALVICSLDNSARQHKMDRWEESALDTKPVNYDYDVK